MAKLLNAAGPTDQVAATFRAMSDNEMIASDLVQRGAIHALETLVQRGATREGAEEMLISARFGREMLVSVAAERGIQLVSEE